MFAKFRKKSAGVQAGPTGPRTGLLAGLAGSESLDDIERARYDIMRACLEAARDAGPNRGEKGVKESVLPADGAPAWPATERRGVPAVQESTLLEPIVEESGGDETALIGSEEPLVAKATPGDNGAEQVGELVCYRQSADGQAISDRLFGPVADDIFYRIVVEDIRVHRRRLADGGSGR